MKNSNKKISFIVQNETHAYNYLPIIKFLIDSGIENSNIETIHLDKLTKLQTSGIIQPEFEKFIDIPIKASFYHLNSRERIKWINNNFSTLRSCCPETKVLVIGNDGAIQRTIAQAVISNGGKVILLLDGLLQPWPSNIFQRTPFLLKKYIYNFAKLLNLEHQVPSLIGHSTLHKIYVMNQSVKSILINQGVKGEIEVISLPRLQKQKVDFITLRKCLQNTTGKWLYATSAYKWHGLLKDEKHQWQDLIDLNNFAKTRATETFRIRVHPREEQSEYQKFNWAPNIQITNSSTTAVQDLAWASALITTRSTLAVEALELGLPVFIYCGNFQHPEKGSIFTNESFSKINDLTKIHLSKKKIEKQNTPSGINRVSSEILTILSS